MIEQKVLQTIEQHNLIASGDRILVAVSGGVDSVVLLRILSKLQSELEIELGVAHLDHQMRDDSHEDRVFVEGLALELGVPCFSEAVDVPAFIEREKRSPEEAARNARYRFFENVASNWGSSKIAVAHNLDDRAETLLLNLLRGSGLDGLSGIPAIRDLGSAKLIRPLFECSREQIELHAKSNNWAYRIDPTNSDPKYTRNRIRQDLMPQLLDLNPNLLETLARTSANLKKAGDYIAAVAEDAYSALVLSEDESAITLDREQILEASKFLMENIIRVAIKRLKGDLDGIESVHLERAISELQKRQSGNRIPFIQDICMVIEPNKIIIGKGELTQTPLNPYEFELELSGAQRFDEIGWSFSVEVTDATSQKTAGCLEALLDFDKITQPLFVRNRRPGDRFEPFGMGGKKKVQDIFVDAKIPRSERDKIPIICDQQGILWVVGVRTGERGRVTSKTERVLRLSAVSIDRSEGQDA